MTLVWSASGDEKTCGVCAALDGSVDGDGWSSRLGLDADLWIKNPNTGQWERKTAQDIFGLPPIHPNCRCSVYDEPTRKALKTARSRPITDINLAEFLHQVAPPH